MNNYEINLKTIAIIPFGDRASKIIEEDNELIVNQSPFSIIQYSCSYFGSSYQGRHAGTKQLTGISHKSPIIIEETNQLIFFPTTSPRLEQCTWFNYKKLAAHFVKNNKTIITMSNGYNLELDISYGIIDNQILRSSYLESILRQRKLN